MPLPFSPRRLATTQSAPLLRLQPEMQHHIFSHLPLRNLTSLAQTSQQAHSNTNKVFTNKARRNFAESHAPLRKLVSAHISLLKWLKQLTEHFRMKGDGRIRQDLPQELTNSGWTDRSQLGAQVHASPQYMKVDRHGNGYALRMHVIMWENDREPTVTAEYSKVVHSIVNESFLMVKVYSPDFQTWYASISDIEGADGIALLYILREECKRVSVTLKTRDALTASLMKLVR